MLKAMTRVADSIEEKVKKINQEQPEKTITAQYYLSHMATQEDIMVQVEEVDFVRALEELIPSVSATELAHYSKVREKFEKVQDDEEEKRKAEEEEAEAEEIRKAIEQAKLKEQEEAKLREVEELQKQQQTSSSSSSSSSSKPSKKSKGKGKARA